VTCRARCSTSARLREGGAAAQFFAVCLPSLPTVTRLGALYPGDWRYLRHLVRIFRRTLEQHPDKIAFAGRAADLERNRAQDLVSAFLTVEDGRLVQGEMANLDALRSLGVRLVTLTWNYANCFGSPNSTDPAVMQQGLTDFGKEAVPEMQKRGILVDVSHLSDGGFRDVAALSTKPFVASHSNCRALCAHPRNLTDEMIRTLAEKGGVAGLNQFPEFLRLNAKENSLGDLTAHLCHMVQVGGMDLPALGSDFDGIHGKLCLKGPQDYPHLAQALRKKGFHESEIEKIFSGNAERVIREAMGT